jgi:glucosamine-6-phosphate deaminase
LISNPIVKCLTVENLNIEVYASGRDAGEAAAQAAAAELVKLGRAQEHIGVVFATGASQLEMLRSLTSLDGVPWSKMRGFHLDEYVGLPVDSPASFRNYLRSNLTQKAPIGSFMEIDGTAMDLDRMCADYAAALRTAKPSICLLGIGENGHLAFNDPGEADFSDPLDIKVVHLDAACREQQAAEGWFKRAEDVPGRAVTLTIPAILRMPRLLVSVPGKRKAQIVWRSLFDEISPDCPATLLRTHPNATLYLDMESSAELFKRSNISGTEYESRQ